MTFFDFVLTAIAAAIGAYGAAYLKRKGENLATKEDLAGVIEQLKATTRATEDVKREINHADWSEREWKTLRRLKLEELLTLARASLEFQERYAGHALFGAPKPEGKDPLFSTSHLVALYLAELAPQMLVLTRALRDHHAFCARADQVRPVSEDEVVHWAAGHTQEASGLHSEIVNAVGQLESAAAKLVNTFR